MSGWDQFQAVGGTPAPASPAAAASGAPAATGWEQFKAVNPPQAQPTPAEDTSMMGRIRSGASWMQNQVTGKDRTEFDYPNLDVGAIAPGGPAKPGQIMLDDEQMRGVNSLGRFDFASDDKGRLDILRVARPDIAETAKTDKFGNIYVSVDGKPAYLNRPGLTGRALASGGASLYSSLPLAMATGLRGVGMALPGRAGSAFGIGAGGSMIQDAIAADGGSKQGVDLPRAAVAGAMGAGFEMAGPAKAALVKLFRGNPQYAQVTTTGGVNLTQAGREAFDAAGIDPQTVSQDALKAFMADVRNAVDPSDAARASGARGLPVPVNLSKGDVTANPAQQMFESLSEKGAYGEGPSRMMRGFRSEQADAIRANVPAIQERIGGGQITERGQAGANVVAALQSQRAAQKAGVDSAYDAARAAGAGVEAPALAGVYSKIVGTKEVSDRIAFAPQANALVTQLGRITQKARAAGDNTTNIRELYDWRRKASMLASEAGTSTDRAAAKAAVRAFDAQMDDIATNALISGDQQAVALWTDAIKKASANFKKWDSDTLVGKLADADPLAASNIIFGSKDAGFINSPELVKGIKTLKDTLPVENWNAIREEAFLRLAQQGEGAYQGATRDFSGVNFKKAWDNFMMKNAPLARELFSGEERQLISQFATTAAKATGKVRGGDNFSNTTVAASNMFQRLFNMPFFGERVASLIRETPGAGAALAGYASVRASGATTGSVPRVRGFPSLSGAVGNAATGDQ